MAILINMILILMMSAKVAAPGSLKYRYFELKVMKS